MSHLATPRPHPFPPYSPSPTEYSEKDLDESAAFLPSSSTRDSSSSPPISAVHSRTHSTASSSSSPHHPAKWASAMSRKLGQRNLTRRGVLVALVALVIVVTVLGTVQGSTAGSFGDAGQVVAGAGSTAGVRQKGTGWSLAEAWRKGFRLGSNEPIADIVKPLDVLKVLNFDAPQDTLRSQLKPGVRYATSMSYGGHANQMISIQKLLYFATITNRVPIIPSLIPVHIDNGGPQDISTFYDLTRLYHESGIPALEMSQVKVIDPERKQQNEDLACWSVQEATAGFPNFEAISFDLHGIYVHHWPLPPLARGAGGFDLAFDALKIFDNDVNYKNAWIDRVRREFLPQKPREHGLEEISVEDEKAREANMKEGFDPRHAPAPDDQIVAFDNSLFLGPTMFPPIDLADDPVEPTVAGEGQSWIEVGQYLHFTDLVERRADEYLARLFGVKSIDHVPPFITVHLRRGDFAEFAGYTDLDKYVAALDRVRTRLQARLDDPLGFSGPGRKNFRSYGLKASEYAVVATTDERSDSPFVAQVKGLGWHVLDHERFETKETFGGWWPTLLDMAVLARGKSFVGTERSTYTHLAGLRVKYWRGGVVELA
ncbi:hypothetical protein JCM10212_000236 [Sporobolomyces blumeae]